MGGGNSAHLLFGAPFCVKLDALRLALGVPAGGGVRCIGNRLFEKATQFSPAVFALKDVEFHQPRRCAEEALHRFFMRGVSVLPARMLRIKSMVDRLIKHGMFQLARCWRG